MKYPRGKQKIMHIFGLDDWIDEFIRLYKKPLPTEKAQVIGWQSFCTFTNKNWAKLHLSMHLKWIIRSRKGPQMAKHLCIVCTHNMALGYVNRIPARWENCPGCKMIRVFPREMEEFGSYELAVVKKINRFILNRRRKYEVKTKYY